MFEKLKSFEYKIGIRKIDNGLLLYEDKTVLRDFVFIKNSFLYWMADPFIIEFNNECFLFVEIGNRISGKGFLAFGKISEGKEIKIKTISTEGFHMSFPNPYNIDNQLYILPETKKDKSLFFYEFDFKNQIIRKKKEIAHNVSFVDSVIYNNYLFCYENEMDINKLLIFNINSSFDLISKMCEKADLGNKLRPAGKIFEHKNIIIFPTQDCSKIYGGGLVFNKIKFEDENFKNEIISTITPKDVCYYTNKSVIGIHTYNKTSKYEVIDIRIKNFNIFGLIGKIYYWIKQKR